MGLGFNFYKVLGLFTIDQSVNSLIRYDARICRVCCASLLENQTVLSQASEL